MQVTRDLCLLDMNKVFVFSILRTIWFWRHHVCILLPQGCNFSLISFLYRPDLPITASSANKHISLKCSSREISFIKIRNSKGPRMEPCGTPQITGIGSDIVFLIFTDCFLSVRYDKNQCCVFTLHSYSFNFSKRISWFTKSNALQRSTNSRPTWFPVYNAESHSSTLDIAFWTNILICVSEQSGPFPFGHKVIRWYGHKRGTNTIVFCRKGGDCSV